jgi:hypothetical protein
MSHPSTATRARSGPAVRVMRREDLPEAATMFARIMRSTPPGSERALAAFFERALFDCPWADPSIPSLVAEDADGAIVGMIGTQTRRLRIPASGQELRLACLGFFAVDARARRGAVGVELARRAMDTGQDATVTDSASVVVESIAKRLGGRLVELKGVHWVRVYRPAEVAGGLAAMAARRLRNAGALHALAGAVDDATAPAAQSLLATAEVQTVAEPLTPALMIEYVDALVEDGGPRVAYDRSFLDWLFGELGRSAPRGEPVAELIRDAGGRVLGWYVYFRRPGGRSEVMQIAARARDLPSVLDHLLRDAQVHGSAALRGRLEPGLAPLVARRRCVLWYRGGTLAYARDPRIVRALEHRGMLSRLDNEWFSDALV